MEDSHRVDLLLMELHRGREVGIAGGVEVGWGGDEAVAEGEGGGPGGRGGGAVGWELGVRMEGLGAEGD